MHSGRDPHSGGDSDGGRPAYLERLDCRPDGFDVVGIYICQRDGKLRLVDQTNMPRDACVLGVCYPFNRTWNAHGEILLYLCDLVGEIENDQIDAIEKSVHGDGDNEGFGMDIGKVASDGKDKEWHQYGKVSMDESK